MGYEQRARKVKAVLDRLRGTQEIWWKCAKPEDLPETYWHWDGQNSWYCYGPDFELNHSSFSPSALDVAGCYRRVPDPRPRVRRAA